MSDFKKRFEKVKEASRKAKETQAKLEAKKERLDEDWELLKKRAKELGVKKIKGMTMAECVRARIDEIAIEVDKKLSEAEAKLGIKA